MQAKICSVWCLCTISVRLKWSYYHNKGSGIRPRASFSLNSITCASLIQSSMHTYISLSNSFLSRSSQFSHNLRHTCIANAYLPPVLRDPRSSATYRPQLDPAVPTRYLLHHHIHMEPFSSRRHASDQLGSRHSTRIHTMAHSDAALFRVTDIFNRMFAHLP